MATKDKTKGNEINFSNAKKPNKNVQNQFNFVHPGAGDTHGYVSTHQRFHKGGLSGAES